MLGNVQSIGFNAFYRCTGLININIPSTVTVIGEYAFYECSSITSITIPNGLTSIQTSTFELCTNLESITIGTSVANIGNTAFASSGITSISIPASVTNIGLDAFRFCLSLTSIFVDSNNPNYSSQDGILFNKLKTILIKCQVLKEGSYNIPNSVNSIERYAFDHCASLTNIIIPNSVNSIGVAAFSFCAILTTLTIPNNVSIIEESTFSKCDNLIRINFLGNAPSFAPFAFGFPPNNSNPKIYRYSTKSGWSNIPGFQLDILLIDSPIDQNLQTFGFENISLGKVSIKKQNLGGGKLKTYKNLILNSKFDVDNQYPYAGYDANYSIDGWISGGSQILTNYYHNSPLFFEPDIDYYITLANRTFHKINSPYDILFTGEALQPRLMKLFGVGSKMGRPDNNTNYLKTITSTTSLTPTDSQSWVKYGVEQIIPIPSSATKIRYGVTYLVKSNDNFRLNNFGGLSLYFQKGSNRSYVNFCYVRNEDVNAEISTLQSLYSSDIYTNFNADLGSNAMCQWLGPNTSKVKVRKRSNVNLASVAGGLPQYLDNLQVLEDTIDIPTFSTSGGQPDANNGFPEYVSLQMFFAEWVSYLNNSGINSGAIYFYQPFLYFV
jgi:hypothetical protein